MDRDKAFDEFYRELVRMVSLLYVVALYIRDNPKIARIFPERITRILASIWPFKMFLAGVFLRDSDGI